MWPVYTVSDPGLGFVLEEKNAMKGITESTEKNWSMAMKVDLY